MPPPKQVLNWAPIMWFVKWSGYSEPAGTDYVHEVGEVWIPHFGIFAGWPDLRLHANFVTQHLPSGSPSPQAASVTLHVGGTTGLPNAVAAGRSGDAREMPSDGEGELITATSGTEVFSLEHPWSASPAPLRHDVDVALPAGLSGFVPFRLAMNAPAWAVLYFESALFTVRAV